MDISEKIKYTLSNVKPVSIGYSEIIFFSIENIEEGQVGYSIDPKGNSLVKRFGDWKSEWIVIGYDDLGDPIFVDCSDDDFSVFTAPHGEGKWEVTLIANTLDNFKDIMDDLSALSVGREYPTAIERNPILDIELEVFLIK